MISLVTFMVTATGNAQSCRVGILCWRLVNDLNRPHGLNMLQACTRQGSEASLAHMLDCLQKRLRVMTATEPSAKIMLQKGKERARCALPGRGSSCILAT